MILVTVSGTSIIVLRTATSCELAVAWLPTQVRAIEGPLRREYSLGWIVPRWRGNVTRGRRLAQSLTGRCAIRTVNEGYSACRSESVRSLATARDTVLFTVPWLTPKT